MAEVKPTLFEAENSADSIVPSNVACPKSKSIVAGCPGEMINTN